MKKQQIECSKCKERHPERSMNDLCDYDCDCDNASTNPYINENPTTTMPHTFTPEKMREEYIAQFPTFKNRDWDTEDCQNAIADYWLSKFEAYKAELRKEIEIISHYKGDVRHPLYRFLSSPLLVSNTKEE